MVRRAPQEVGRRQRTPRLHAAKRPACGQRMQTARANDAGKRRARPGGRASPCAARRQPTEGNRPKARNAPSSPEEPTGAEGAFFCAGGCVVRRGGRLWVTAAVRRRIGMDSGCRLPRRERTRRALGRPRWGRRGRIENRRGMRLCGLRRFAASLRPPREAGGRCTAICGCLEFFLTKKVLPRWL